MIPKHLVDAYSLFFLSIVWSNMILLSFCASPWVLLEGMRWPFKLFKNYLEAWTVSVGLSGIPMDYTSYLGEKTSDRLYWQLFKQKKSWTMEALMSFCQVIRSVILGGRTRTTAGTLLPSSEQSFFYGVETELSPMLRLTVSLKIFICCGTVNKTWRLISVFHYTSGGSLLKLQGAGSSGTLKDIGDVFLCEDGISRGRIGICHGRWGWWIMILRRKKLKWWKTRLFYSHLF